MGINYLITTTKSHKAYVGQTINTMEHRWYEHKQCARMLDEYNRGVAKFNTTSVMFAHIKNSLLYKAMVKYGIDTFSIQLLEELDDDCLNEAETWYIELYNTLTPNGYNLTSGGDSRYRHAPQSIELMKQVKRENLNNNRHEYLHNMPPCTSYGNNIKKGGEWILVQNHPQCTYRCFLFKDYDNNLEKVQAAVIEFVRDIEASRIKYEFPKKEHDLKPYPGLKATKKGYKLEKYIKGTKYQQGFESQKFTRDENKQRAIDYYKTHITPLL